MIDGKGRLRCDKCGTVIGEYTEKMTIIRCWRTKCKHVNIFRVDKKEKVVIQS